MIVDATDPILLRVADRVPPDFDVGPVVAKLWEALLWSQLRGRPGDGLSAPQVGVSLRIFVVRGFPPFVNPRVTRHSSERAVKAEGCLSLPVDVSVLVERPVWVKVVNGRGSPTTMKLRDWDARVFMHEMDHLRGVLITDRKPVSSAAKVGRERPDQPRR